MIIKPVLGRQLNSGHPLARGLVGCWLMNEGGGNRVADLSGNDNNGTINSGNANNGWRSGMSGPAFYGDGNAYAQIDTTLSLPSTPDFSVVMNVKLRDVSNDQCGLFYFDGTYIHNNSQFSWRFISGPAGLSVSAGTPLDETWTHIATTFEDNVAGKIYLDGVLAGTDSAVTSVTVASPVLLATEADGSTDSLDGLMDYCYVYIRVLTAGEIAYIYRNPFCMFDTVM